MSTLFKHNFTLIPFDNISYFDHGHWENYCKQDMCGDSEKTMAFNVCSLPDKYISHENFQPLYFITVYLKCGRDVVFGFGHLDDFRNPIGADQESRVTLKEALEEMKNVVDELEAGMRRSLLYKKKDALTEAVEGL